MTFSPWLLLLGAGALAWLWRPSSASASLPSEDSGLDDAAWELDGFDPLFGTAPPPLGDLVSAFTGRAATLPAWEQLTILQIAGMVGVDPVALAAIRLAENGGPGREFGVLSVPAPTYAEQARVAAESIKANLRRTGLGSITEDFWAAMGARWAPLGAANDPTGLNANWVRNVRTFYSGSGLSG